MAVIINTAMESVRCAAYNVFSGVKCIDVLQHILHTFVLKCVTWMLFVPIVAIDCYVYELVCLEGDKSWSKLIQKVNRLNTFGH